MPDAMPNAEEIAKAEEKFRPFLDANQGTSVAVFKRPKGESLGIKKPWGEDGLVIFIPNQSEALADALNSLLLPKPLTAVWHRDKKELEVIWTAYPLPDTNKEVSGRKFVFSFEGMQHECEFTGASERLLTIAENSFAIGVSDTQHRNLQSFHQYARWRRDNKDKPEAPPPVGVGTPHCFWIKNIEWDEDRVLHLTSHLNFYMTYFDRKSPFILSWPPKAEAWAPPTRYIHGEFPTRIDAHQADDNVLQFWSACRSGDTGKKFVYYYRIIEAAAYTYVERDVRRKTKMALSAPNALSNVATLTDKVIGIVLGSDMDDGARISALLVDCVDPSLLWREIILNRKAFEEATLFDGGYSIEPLITSGDTEKTFSNGGLRKFAQHARHIRNHLSHGRDRTTLTSITPTEENFRRLEPWVGAISLIAGEVINYKDVL